VNVTSAEASLAGRVALVTGASSGIGRAAAVALARLGTKVLGVARDPDRLASLAAATGVETLALSLGEPGASARAVEAARTLGPVTVLVHAAGRGGFLDRPIFDQPLEGWREAMAVNLDAAFELSQLVARDIRDAGWGRIVLVSSTAGEVGAPSMAPYCASKHGLNGLMRSLAHDLAPHGGTCNAVLPGWVRTRMADQDALQEARRRALTVEEVWAERAAANPRGQLVTPEEVAAVIAFLASAAASGVNGEAITVSGGSLW
jgi:NAD(P)-dependent dehydrogenase (short-subunit alcohol dehydrogenase family)